MNKVYLSVQAIEDPKEIYIDQTRTNVILNCLVPPATNKAPTPITVHIYGKDDKARVISSIKAGSTLFIAGGKLRHDLKTREHSVHGGSIYPVNHQTFGIVNEVILGGRCIRGVDKTNDKEFRKTDSGFLITNQTLSVNTGKQQCDLFNLYSINKHDDRYNLAELLATMTHKGTGLTISGRLTTDAWTDKATGQPKSSTKIQVQNMTLAPKPTTPGEVQASNTMPANTKPASLWGGQTLANESPHQDAMAQPQKPPLPEIALDPWMKAEAMAEAVAGEPVAAVEPAVVGGPLPELPSNEGDDDAPF